MKKGRPGQRLEVLCREADRAAIVTTLLEETTTIGVRWFPVSRTVLPRVMQTVTTRFGEIRVKVVTLPSGKTRRTPEYEDCRARAVEHGVSVRQVMGDVWRTCIAVDTD
jgi:uncharacterized protein (DUF111 family)